ncbi:hypothetical protein PL373_18510 [Tenacibaculum maritimum]|nr:hypothetical protein [Tenacibaculum maritimum]MDB0603082.1 hypothetical protein [Tenacibaculum maritimum]MDB0611652.1 hypothetical protein [Tenacibaculum maritimum]
MEEIEWQGYKTIEEAKTDLNNLKTEWEKIKKTKDFKYPDYTEDKLKEIKFWIFDSDLEDVSKIIKVWGIAVEIRKVHFTGKLKLNFILSFSNSSDKILQFTKYCNELSDEEYWKNLSIAYTMQDYNKVPYEIIYALFNADKTNKECLMVNDELEYFNNLPDNLMIHRAMTITEKKSGKYRFSWTLSEKVAEKFLERNSMSYDEEMTIHSIQVNKKDVLAYLNSRNEEEIIYITNNDYN